MVLTFFLASPSHMLCLQDENLIKAAEKGNLTDVKKLLKAGANVNAIDQVCLFRIK